MARLPRLTVPSYPHHIIQRGNNRQPTFFAEKDYHVFLDCLREAKRKCHTRLYAYVLMTNHVHLLLEPEQDGDLGRFMQSVRRRYVRYVNATHNRSGTLWEGRFRSAVVSRDEYLIVCTRYIELNPVRAGMASHPAEYRWSSYRHRALGHPDDLVDDDPWYRAWGAVPKSDDSGIANGLRRRLQKRSGRRSGKLRNRAECWAVRSFRSRLGGGPDAR